MKPTTIEIPADFNLDIRETRRFLAAKLYESGKLSLGQNKANEFQIIGFLV